jgi:glutamyl-tRNA synthetase (EC 6.1.1.17)
VLSDEALDFNDRDTVFDACKPRPKSWARRTAGCSTRWASALSGKQRTPGGGTDLACMMGRENDPRAGEGRHREAEWVKRPYKNVRRQSV